MMGYSVLVMIFCMIHHWIRWGYPIDKAIDIQLRGSSLSARVTGAAVLAQLRFHARHLPQKMEISATKDL